MNLRSSPLRCDHQTRRSATQHNATKKKKKNTRANRPAKQTKQVPAAPLSAAGIMGRNVAEHKVTNQISLSDPALTTSALCAQHLRRTSLTSAAVSVDGGGTRRGGERGGHDAITKKVRNKRVRMLASGGVPSKVTMVRTTQTGSKKAGLFTGHEPPAGRVRRSPSTHRCVRVGRGGTRNVAGLAESGRAGLVDPIRPVRRVFTRHVNSPKIRLYRTYIRKSGTKRGVGSCCRHLPTRNLQKRLHDTAQRI